MNRIKYLLKHLFSKKPKAYRFVRIFDPVNYKMVERYDVITGRQALPENWSEILPKACEFSFICITRKALDREVTKWRDFTEVENRRRRIGIVVQKGKK